MFISFYVNWRQFFAHWPRALARRASLGVLGAVALLPAHAAAAVTPPGPARPAFHQARRPGPTSLSTGFEDDNTFQNPVDSFRNLWFQRARNDGATWIRLEAYWNLIAPAQRPAGFNAADPASPGYDWSYLDGAVRSADAVGQRIMVTISYAPRWALGRNPPRGTPPGTYKPSPADLGQFATALARRYSGHFPDPLVHGANLPRVTYFQAWNEPNINVSLSPQWERGARGRLVPASPAYYRRMLNAVYRSVNAADPRAYVLSAGLAPYGNPPGGGRVGPVLFMRDLLCLRPASLRATRCPGRAHFDGFDHHPYSINPTSHAVNATDASVPDIGRLIRLVRAARRDHTVLPAGPKGIWVTELNWGSNPPDPHAISLTKQAGYLARAFYVLWSQGVSHVFWYLIRDPGFSDDGLTGSGVFFANGTPKPAATGFRFPFVALARRHGGAILWARAPAPGQVTVQVERGGRWRYLLRARTTGQGIFYARHRVPRGTRVRADLNGQLSLTQSVS